MASSADFTETGNFWTEAATDCVKSVTEWLSVQCRHTNFNSYTQILGRQQNSSAITHFRLSEPHTPLRGTQFEKHWLRSRVSNRGPSGCTRRQAAAFVNCV